MQDNKTSFLIYVNSKSSIRENIGLLLDEFSHLTSREIDKAEMFNAFFTSVFNTEDWPWNPRSPVLEECVWGNDNLPVNSDLV